VEACGSISQAGCQLTEYEPIWKGEVIRSMVIHGMISQGDSFRLSPAYYGKDMGCHDMFT